MKSYRLTSRLRFIAFVAITIILFTLIFNAIFSLSLAHSESNEKYINVGIVSGDTLWSIAETYMPDMDTREAVYLICQINGLDSCNLMTGSVIQIPV